MKKIVKSKLIIPVLVIIIFLASGLILLNTDIINKLKGNILESSDKEESEVCDITKINDSYLRIIGTIDQDYGSSGNATISLVNKENNYTKEINVKTNEKTNFNYVLAKGEYQLTITKDGYDKYEETISESKKLDITLHNNEIGNVIATDQIGDNLYYNYYSNGLLHIKGTGDMWDGYDVEADGPSSENIKYNATILNDVLMKVLEKKGFKLTDEQTTVLDSYFFGINIGNSSAAQIILGKSLDDFKEALEICDGSSGSSVCDSEREFLDAFGKEKIMEIINILTEIPKNTNVVIEDGVTSIGTYSLFGINTNELIIPDSVTSYNEAPIGYSNIKTLTLSKKGKSKAYDTLGDYMVVAFSTSIDNLNVYGLEEINEHTFEDCTITNLKISGDVKIIGNNAFKNTQDSAAGLKTLILENGVETIGEAAFQYNHLTNLVLPKSVKTIESYAFNQNYIFDLELPNGLEKIGNGSFSSNYITELDIPTNVDKIGDYAFGHNKIENLIIPKNVKEIGSSAFSHNNIYNLTLNEGIKKIGSMAFDRNNITDLKIPDSLTELGGYCFYQNKIEEITIPGQIAKIEVGTFSYNNLQKVIIKKGVKDIETTAFGYNKITTLVIPESVTSIGTDAFRANQLTKITIPESVTSIGNDAFRENQLSSIIIKGNEKRFNEYWTLIGFPEELKPQ